MADLQTSIEILQRSIDKLADNIYGGAMTERRRRRELPNTVKDVTEKRDPKKEADQALRTEKALKELDKSLKNSFKSQEMYGSDMRVAGKAFENAVQKISLKQFDELPKRISELTKDIGLQFKTKADIDKALAKYSEENIDAAKKLYDQYIDLASKGQDFGTVLDKLTKLGYEDISELKQSREQLMETGTALGKALNKSTLEIERHAASTQKWTTAINYATVAAGFIAEKFIETSVASAKYNTTIASTAEGMVVLGMSADAYGKLQNEQMQALVASGRSLEDFNKQTRDAGWALLNYAGTPEEGAKLQAQLSIQSQKLTASGADQLIYQAKSTDQFKKMHTILGTTVEQFESMDKTLMASQSVQTNLYRINQSQRIQAELGLRQQVLYLQTQGLEQKEAEGVVDMFQQLNAQSPKNRRKQAAELMAVGGAIGLGPETQELGALLTRGARTPAEQQRQVELQAQIQRKVQAQYAATAPGGAAEMVLNELTNRPAVQQILGQTGPAALLGTRQGLAIDPAKAEAARVAGEKRTHGLLNTINSSILGLNSVLKGAFGTGIVGVVGSVLALLKGKDLLMSLLGKGGSSLLGRGAATAAEGLAGEAGLGAAATGAGAVGAAGLGAAATAIGAAAVTGAAAYGLTTLVTDTIPKALGANQGLGEWIGGKIFDVFGQKTDITAPSISNNYSKNAQVADIIKSYNEDMKEGKNKEAKDLMDKMDALVTAMAIANKQDPAAAVAKLHKTIKDQHQENKQMTQEQIDATNKTKDVKLVPTSHRIPSAA